MGLFALEAMWQIVDKLKFFALPLGFASLHTTYTAWCLANAFVNTYVSTRRWWARRSGHVNDGQEGESADEGESTEELLLVDPANTRQAGTTNDPVVMARELPNDPSAAGSGGGVRVGTMAEKPLGTPPAVRTNNSD